MEVRERGGRGGRRNTEEERRKKRRGKKEWEGQIAEGRGWR